MSDDLDLVAVGGQEPVGSGNTAIPCEACHVTLYYRDVSAIRAPRHVCIACFAAEVAAMPAHEKLELRLTPENLAFLEAVIKAERTPQ